MFANEGQSTSREQQRCVPLDLGGGFIPQKTSGQREGGDQGNVNPDGIETAVFTGLRCSRDDDRGATGDAWDPGPSCDILHPLSHTFWCSSDHSGPMRAVLEHGLLRWNDSQGAYSVPN